MKKFYPNYIIVFLSVTIYATQGFTQTVVDCYIDNAIWIKKTSMPQTSTAHTGCHVHDELYFFGGGTIFDDEYVHIDKISVYNPSLDSWKQTQRKLPIKASFMTSCILGDKVMLSGGVSFTEIEWTFYNNVYLYDPIKDSFEVKNPYPLKNGDLNICNLNGNIYGVGGSDTNFYSVNNVYVYNAINDTWQPKAPLNIARIGASLVVFNGKIYTIGGILKSETENTPLKSVEVYDPINDSWTLVSNMISSRIDMYACILDTMIFVMGGKTSLGGPPLKTLQIYVPESDQWFKSHIKLPIGLAQQFVCSESGSIYSFGGYSGNGFNPVDSVWLMSYNPIYQKNPIDIVQLNYETFGIDLNNYFAHDLERELNYSVCDSWNSDIIDANIEGSTLTITKKNEGIDTLYLLMESGNDQFSSTVVVNATSTNIENPFKNKILVYPNPTTNHLNIKLANDKLIKRVDIVSLGGKTTYKNCSINNHQISIRKLNLSPGIYFLTIYADKVYNQKITVQH